MKENASSEPPALRFQLLRQHAGEEKGGGAFMLLPDMQRADLGA